jgi:hypothetical protein
MFTLRNQNDPFYTKTEIRYIKFLHEKMPAVSIVIDEDMTIQVGDHKVSLPADGVELQGEIDNFVLRFFDGASKELPVTLNFASGLIQFIVYSGKATGYVNSQFDYNGQVRAYKLVQELCEKQFSEQVPPTWTDDIYNEFMKYSVNDYEVAAGEDDGSVYTEIVYQFENLPTEIAYFVS